MTGIRYLRRFVPCFALTAACVSSCGSDDGGPTGTAVQTRTDLIAHTWQVSEATLGTFVLKGEPGQPPPGFEELSITFKSDNTYSFTFPGGNCGIPDGVHTISGPWSFSEGETQVILDRSNAEVGETEDFVWEITELTFGNLKTSYTAPIPPPCTEGVLVITWVVTA